MARDRRPGSASSVASSERILALGNHVYRPPVKPSAPVDLADAEEHEHRLADAIATVKDQLTELIKTCPMGMLPDPDPSRARHLRTGRPARAVTCINTFAPA